MPDDNLSAEAGPRSDEQRAGSPAPPAGGVPITGSGGRRINTLAEWFEFAPPAGGARQWRDRRSAKELARRWIAGGVPPEVAETLDASPGFRGFRGTQGWAELRTRFDALAGNTRNQDLVVRGRTADGDVLLDIEGKADEPFGTTVGIAVRDAAAALAKNPRSGAANRVRELCRAVLGVSPEEASDVGYQLVYGVAAAVVRARMEGVRRVAFIVHEFRSPETSAQLLGANDRALKNFVTRLGDDPRALSSSLVGPFRLPGNAHVPRDVDLYIGKVIAQL